MRLVMSIAVMLGLASISDRAGSTIRVASGGDLQTALNNARPGDTVLLSRDGTYLGNLVLPARRGDDDRVITLRTEGDEGFPREGERMTPAAAAHLAKLRSPDGSPTLQTSAGTTGWRIALVELQATRDEGGTIVALGDGSSAQRSLDSVPSSLTLDRLYIHGDAG